MTNKIPLYQVRNFSEKFSATFDFLRQNWRLFLRLSVYLILPLCIVEGIFANSYYSTMLRDVFSASKSNYDDTPWGMTALVGVVSLITTIMIISLTYAIMKRYEQSDGNISELTLKDLWPTINKNIGRTFRVILAYVLVYVAFAIAIVLISGAAALAANPGFAIILAVLLFFCILAIIPPMALFVAIYMLEDNAKLWPSLKKAFVYGFKTWGGLFALLFVIGIIASFMSYFVMLPGFIVGAFKETLFPATFTGSGILPLLYTALLDVLIIVGQYASCLFIAVPLVAVGFHYGHAADLLDNVSVAEDIDHFDDLADNGEDAEETDAPDIPDIEPEKKDDIDNFNNL